MGSADVNLKEVVIVIDPAVYDPPQALLDHLQVTKEDYVARIKSAEEWLQRHKDEFENKDMLMLAFLKRAGLLPSGADVETWEDCTQEESNRSVEDARKACPEAFADIPEGAQLKSRRITLIGALEREDEEEK